MDHVEITDINEQYLSEFLEALQSAINQMSADGTRISFVTSKASELGRYMAKCLDESWNQMRGMEVQSVGIASLSYDEKSQELINTRNEGAMPQIHLLHRDIWSKICQRVSRTQAATVVELCRASWVSAWE